MKCPKCGCHESGVLDSRLNEEGNRWRRHKCKECSGRFSTLEIPIDEANQKIMTTMAGRWATWEKRLGNLEKDLQRAKNTYQTFKRQHNEMLDLDRIASVMKPAREDKK